MDDISQALSGMAQQGRQPMGTDAITNVNTNSTFLHPDLVRAKYAIQGSDPALVPGAVPRNPVMAERLGPRFAPAVSINKPVLPEAAATQANGRIIPPRTIRSQDSFSQGAAS
jgi:hypothetical protein